MELEDHLLVAAKRGDRLALQRILVGLAPTILSHIQKQRAAYQDQVLDDDDLLQQTLVDVCRDVAKFQGSSLRQFEAWARSIANNTIHDAVRRLNRVKRGGRYRQQWGALGSSRSVIDVLESLSSGDPSPSSRVRHLETVGEVREAIDGLPPDYRRAVELRFLEGRDLTDVARLMQRGPRAVQGLLDRARKILRRELERRAP